MEELRLILKQNVRDYGMFIALFAIITFFSVATDGAFIQARNISNLLNQTGYIAVLAIGVTLVIIIRHTDLSIGYIAGFMGAIIALMLKNEISLIVAIPVALVIGIIIGLFNGFLVAKLEVPAFVATLAGMLIFKGCLLLATQATGSIIVTNEVFNAIGNGFIPNFIDVQVGNITNFTTIIVGVVVIALFIVNEIKVRNEKMKYNFKVLSNGLFAAKLVFVSGMVGILVYALSTYNGISWTVVVVAVIAAIYHFITTKTALGRYIYAVGGNPEAARLSGISVEKITLTVYGSMGMLAVVAGILYTSRLQSATPSAGQMFELDAIAAAFVGGVSSAGGVGKVTNSVLGAVVMASLINGMDLMGVDISYQYIIKGAVLVAAVVFDITTRNKVK